MWFNKIFNRNSNQPNTLSHLFDEATLRRLEKLSYRTAPTLRGTIVGERRSRRLRPASDFSDHRPYAVGDDLRHVDWRAFGRTDSLFVRLGESPQSVDIHVLVDRSPSMSWQPPDKTVISKWDGARRLAGALSYLALAGGERVHITPFDLQLGESFGPTRGKQQTIRAMQFIADIESTAVDPQQGFATASGAFRKARQDIDLSESLTRYARQHPQGGLLILISDLLDTIPAVSDDQISAADKLTAGLRYLTPPRWQVLVIHLLTEQEISPNFEGDFDLRDMETGEHLPFSFDEATLTQYRLRVQRWSAELQSACAKRAATYARVSAEWPLEETIVPYLRQRGVV